MLKVFSKINKKKLLHIVFRPSHKSQRINITPEKEFLQISSLKFSKNKIINAHKHLNHDMLKKKRPIQESWILIKGLAKISFFDLNKKLLKIKILKPGDISVSFAGAHKLQIMKNNTRIYEYKTGPYKGSNKDLKFL